MNPIYLSTIDDQAHLTAKQFGFGVELAEFCTPWYLDTELAQIDPIIREKRSCCSHAVLHAPFSEMFPCAIDPKIRAVATERFRQVVDVAERYDIEKIVVHGGYNPKIYYPVWYVEQSVRFWTDFLPQIPAGMVFCLENVFEEEPTMLAEIVRQVNDSRIRMCLDVGHVNAYSKIPVMEWLNQCADLICHFHLHNNDTSRDSHSQLWDGTIDIKQLLRTIYEKCPEASITLELMDCTPSIAWIMEECQ